MPEASTTTTPYQTEREAGAASLWARLGRPSEFMTEANITDLGMALTGIEVGGYDRRIMAWLARYEPSMVAVVAGWINRARATGLRTEPAGSVPDLTTESPDPVVSLSPADLQTTVIALGVAADYKRDRAACCPDCDGSAADPCGTCTTRLSAAASYDDLTGRLGGNL